MWVLAKTKNACVEKRLMLAVRYGGGSVMLHECFSYKRYEEKKNKNESVNDQFCVLLKRSNNTKSYHFPTSRCNNVNRYYI